MILLLVFLICYLFTDSYLFGGRLAGLIFYGSRDMFKKLFRMKRKCTRTSRKYPDPDAMIERKSYLVGTQRTAADAPAKTESKAVSGGIFVSKEDISEIKNKVSRTMETIMESYGEDMVTYQEIDENEEYPIEDIVEY